MVSHTFDKPFFHSTPLQIYAIYFSSHVVISPVAANIYTDVIDMFESKQHKIFIALFSLSIVQIIDICFYGRIARD